MSELPDVPHVSEEEYRDLLERAGLINETAGTAGWSMLVDFVNEQRAALQAKLATGGAQDWEDYQRITQWLRGAEYVLNAPDTVNQRVAEYKAVLDDQK